MNTKEKIKIRRLKNVIRKQAGFIQYQRETILDLNKIIDILFNDVESLICDKTFNVDKLRKEVWQCVEENDAHSVDFADVDTKEVKNA